LAPSWHRESRRIWQETQAGEKDEYRVPTTHDVRNSLIQALIAEYSTIAWFYLF
jgi:hypothetical protein